MLLGREDGTPAASRRQKAAVPTYQRLLPAGLLACTCGPAPAPPPTCLRGRGGEVGRTGERRKEGRRRPLGVGSIGWAGGVSGPLRAAPEEVPGPGGSALSFLVLLGRDCPCGCGRALCPVPAQVPPAWPHGPGNSEPLAPRQRPLHAGGARGESHFTVVLPTQLAACWTWGKCILPRGSCPASLGVCGGGPQGSG